MKIKEKIAGIGTKFRDKLASVEKKRTEEGKRHSLISRLNKDLQKRESKKTNYISAKESARISRENRKITNKYEKERKRRRVPESEYLTTMHDSNNVVEFDDLHTYFFTDIGTVKAVDGVTFEVPHGKTVGVVGESGCGKSVTSLSLMRLVQRPQGQTIKGEIRFNLGDKAYDITKCPETVMQTIRGNSVSMIFQEPMTSLNPVFRVGAQVDEVLLLHNKDMTKLEAKERTLELLNLVGIANGERVYTNFPHELSGGMRQRIVIAMALACNPRLIIADEPTTALDVTIQAQILDLLRDVKDKINSSIMLITHDLGVIAGMADYVVVMYAGRIVEKGTAAEIFGNPSHPYTIGLMKSKPVVGRKVDKLYNIPGNVPNPIDMPNYCYYKDRCDYAMDICNGEYPKYYNLSETHCVNCYRYAEISAQEEKEGGENGEN
ncbi:MAG: oligopeptide/dipeptide ABC transporter ATP-binding protein [Christensenellales bacterium]|jgi:peptide/nickel transport system ATP-binding protein